LDSISLLDSGQNILKDALKKGELGAQYLENEVSLHHKHGVQAFHYSSKSLSGIVRGSSSSPIKL
jgi:hypothetical protein